MPDANRTPTPTAEPSPGPETWTVVIVPIRGDVPPAVRVRRWLKAGLRAFGLRCVAVVRHPTPPETAAARAAGHPLPTTRLDTRPPANRTGRPGANPDRLTNGTHPEDRP